MQFSLPVLWHRYKTYILSVAGLLLLAGGVAAYPPSRHFLIGVYKEQILGIHEDSEPIPVAESSEDVLSEQIKQLEAKVVEVERKYQEQVIAMASLKVDFQAAISETAKAQDEAVKQTAKLNEIGKQLANSSPPSAVENDASSPSSGKKININTASVSELDGLPGIGPSYAQRIVDYRKEHGSFKTIDELDNVTGIGQSTIDKLRELVEV